MMTKQIRSILTLAFAACLTSTLASAQRGPDVFFGVGTATDGATGPVDTFGDGVLYNAPKLAGSFGKVGGDFMLTKHFGIGAETDFRFGQSAYAGVQTRPVFYDFNGIFMPTFGGFKRIVPEFEAGVGAAHMGFSYSQAYCNGLTGCSSQTAALGSSNHFQVHMSAGIRFYATNHIFFRPQIDARYVDNFFQYGSNWVPEYGASLGWSFGER